MVAAPALSTLVTSLRGSTSSIEARTGFRVLWGAESIFANAASNEILLHNIAAVQETVRHVLTVARVALDQHACPLRVAAAHEVHALAGDKNRMELIDVHVQRTVENRQSP